MSGMIHVTLDGANRTVFVDRNGWSYSIEPTLGSFFVRVSSMDHAWVGLYRLETHLFLRARCQGIPPKKIELEPFEQELLKEQSRKLPGLNCDS